MMLVTGFIKYGRGFVLDKKYKKMQFQIPKKIAFIVALMTLGNANAAIVLEHSGKISLGTEYHSNILFLDDSVRESTSTYLTSIVPEYRFTALDERNKWFGNIGINLVDSSNEDIMTNRQDPFGELGWERALENGLLSLSADYLRESTRFSQFDQTGVIRQDGTSVNRTIEAKWQHNISQKWGILTEASYDETKFGGVSLLSDFSTRNLSAELMYTLNETFSPYAKIAAHDYRASGQGALGGNDSTRIRYQDYLVGAAVEVSPQFKFNVNTGIVNFDSSADDEWVGELKTAYLGNRYEINGTLARTVFPVGLNQILLGDELRVNYSYLQSEISKWGLSLALTQNDLGIDTQDFGGFYGRDLSRDWLVRLDLAARKLKFEGAESNHDISLGIFFTYTTPNF